MGGFDRVASESAVIALMRAGNYRGAEARLRTMLAQDPNNARALALMANCQLDAGDEKKALEIARSAAALAPDDPLVRAMLSSALLRTRGDKKQRHEALGLAEDVASENPDDSDALFSLAIARFNTGDHIGARDLFDDAERLAGSAYELLNVALLRLHEWNYAAAADLAQRAMQLDPTRPEVFTVLAECAIAQKRPVDSYELALEALRLSPGDPKIMRILTRARARARPWLRPFLPLVDWIVEMDRRGLFVVPVLMCVLGFVFVISLAFDLQRIEAGVAPAVILSAASGVALICALVSYFTAVFARLQIRRDLRRISLPKF